MLLKDVLDSLRYGELSLLSIGGELQGKITKNNFTAVATHINSGLTNLYTRFKLKVVSTELALTPAKYEYKLTYPDLLKVIRVYGNTGYEFTLNDLHDEYSIHTPTAKALTVPASVINLADNLPNDLKINELKIVYQAKHPWIDTASTNILDEEELELELPEAYLDALSYFVASRMTNPLDVAGQFHSGNNYAAKYEQACNRLELSNMSIDSGAQSNRFQSKGWV